MESRKNEILNSPLFELVSHKIVETKIDFTSNEYIKLLKTFPDHSTFSTTFFREIAEIIEIRDNTIKIKITTNLEIAKRIN
ncbi:MAG TPA: hypothetical protein DEG28_10650 [Porphyromonadaceae bacterium]|nr:hypothetical protein [Porphyromonadaceae bacterium]